MGTQDADAAGSDSGYNSARIQYAERAESRVVNDGHLPNTGANSQSLEDKLKKWKPGKLFVDRSFPTDNPMVLASNERGDTGIRWKRPKELVERPQLLVNGISRGDIAQGNLADCWLLSSCAAIAQKPHLMKKVIAHDQPLYGRDYKGLICFRFWRFGRWERTYVDDKLPVAGGGGDALLYARGTDRNEFWVSLLEKAYAKLHGSYAALEGGQAMDALVDLTGGLAERYELADCGDELYGKLAAAHAADAFVTCSRKGDWRSQHHHADHLGLIAGHAYTITSVRRIRRVRGYECLMRIRNPWGMGDEWNGAWSDNDDRWQLVDAATKRDLEFERREDGEFWMCFDDFRAHFQEVTICTLGPDFDGDGRTDATGTIIARWSQWKAGRSAGGCRNDLHSFATNPQFLLTVTRPDERGGAYLPEDEAAASGTCSVLVALMQDNRAAVAGAPPRRMLQIGFILYKTNSPRRRLPARHFMYHYETAKSGTYVNFREVCGRFDLKPGYYVIIPSTYEPEEEGRFLLRVYASKEIRLDALADHGEPADEQQSDAAGSTTTGYDETGFKP